jgi:chromosomal replication initiator protein
VKKEIINKCAELFDVHPRDLVSDARFGFLIPARFALYKTLHMRGWSYSRIGRELGGRDHATVIHGVNRADYMMEKDPDYTRKVELLADMKPKALDPSLLPPQEEPEPEPEEGSELRDFLYD